MNLIALFIIVLALLLVLNVWLVLRVLMPLRGLAARAEQVANGHLEALECHSVGIQEIKTLQRSMAGMVGHVRRAQAQHRAYADAITSGQEVERRRIARELHDDTVQALVAIGQSIDMARQWLDDTQRARDMLQTAREQSVEAVERLREHIDDLRPPALDELGLETALKMFVERLPQAVEISTSGDARRLPPRTELALFRCAQEALHNAVHHSQANTISLYLAYGTKDTHLTIQDDGVGFREPETFETLGQRGSYGLLGMEERINQVGGTLSVQSEPGEGTTIRVSVPTDGTHETTVTVRDPVCGAEIKPESAYGSVMHEGKQYYFCCPVCQGAFQREPDTYLSIHNRDLTT